MLSFFDDVNSSLVTAIESIEPLSDSDNEKLSWLLGGANPIVESSISGYFIGPRAAMVTPWSTNAVEITQNMGIRGITRIECFEKADISTSFDPMLFQKYSSLHQSIFKVDIEPEPTKWVDDIAGYNEQEGLALSVDEVRYLEELSERIGRLLTDSEVFGFSQVNSEHCRHKIFNGTFIIDGQQKPKSLFQLIKETSRQNPNDIVSAYKDNVAFIKGPFIQQFAPQYPHVPSKYVKKEVKTVLSLKAETHNFPTTVEPFNGAATGSGGEIRDRMAGGQGSIPLAGTAVYMTAYPRQGNIKDWESKVPERSWLYQKPIDILIKASNGASDFGNKFGQPLIAGALLTFEHQEDQTITGYDKVIMLAGGIGYGLEDMAQKQVPGKGDKVILLGGDNYRIGMGGAAVSSADTGEFSSAIELNAVQRSNPEMQKRVANTIRALVEQDKNPIVSIHDHGAGGHLNCLSELVEQTGGTIFLDNLPVGDPTLSAREIIGNESQERMGLIVSEDQVPLLQQIADRERAPMYLIGEVTDDHRFQFVSNKTGDKPIDLALSDFFGSSPALILQDNSSPKTYSPLVYDSNLLDDYLNAVLQLESVACKDWLTNKVDRCVGGRVAIQQCTGIHQLPLNNCGVMALDFESHKGIATSIGQAPIAALIDPAAGSVLAITEALTNIVWAPLESGLRSVSLSANWMWPCKNSGEDARLYAAVEACSQFAIELGINIPTGKDSLSMKQKYPDGQEVLAPGTVIISAIGACNDIRKVVEPYLKPDGGDIYYIDWSRDLPQLGGSAFAQILSGIGSQAPTVRSASHVVRCFDTIQALIKGGRIAAGHDISSGGLITTLLEMAFSTDGIGLEITLPDGWQEDWVTLFFAENPGVVIQAKQQVEDILHNAGIGFVKLGSVNNSGVLSISQGEQKWQKNIADARSIWYEPSYWMDRFQSGEEKALERKMNLTAAPMIFKFPNHFDPSLPPPIKPRFKAAVIREKGSNSEREMANALHLAGFEVIDVHMTDLMSGRETLDDIHFIGAVGGFSNSDVLGSAKGWAGAFLYNENARNALNRFFEREDTLSVGICNGCQLFMELGLVYPDHEVKPTMTFNDSHKHESNFVQVIIEENNSVMLSSLKGARLGVWISHGEGKFKLPLPENAYQIAAKYAYSHYPANPNGSDYDTAMLCSKDGRHLVMMPHIERSIFPWNWAFYPEDRKHDTVSPWLEAFVNARLWLESKVG